MELLEQTKIYCELVSIDHHKDRDMHFEIIKRYSYGQEPYWYIYHNGYITDMEIDVMQKQYKTLEDAEKAKIVWLRNRNTSLLKIYQDLPEDSDFNVADAKRLVDKYKHLTPTQP